MSAQPLFGWEIQTRQALGNRHQILEVHSFTSGGETLHTLSTKAVSASQKDRVCEIVLDKTYEVFRSEKELVVQ